MVYNILNVRGRRKNADASAKVEEISEEVGGAPAATTAASTSSGVEKQAAVQALKLQLLSGIGASQSVDELLAAIRSSLPVDVNTEDTNFQETFYQKPVDAEQAGRTLANISDDPKINELMTRFREACKSHGARGIFGIGRKFRILDDDNSGSLCFPEFMKGISELKLDFNYSEVRDVFRYFDENCDGHIQYEEFLTGIRGELNERRKALVLQAFVVLDKDSSGDITIKDVVGRYDTSFHPGVIDGSRTEASVFMEFLQTFEGGGEKDGIVTPDEFVRYYSNVSASIDEDDYFELMIRNAWHLSGGKGQFENTTCLRVLVTHYDGRQTVEEITNDFDIAKDDIPAMKANLAQRGIQAQSISTVGSAQEATPAPMSPVKSAEPTLPGTPGSNNRGRGRGAGPSSIVFG